MGNRCGNRTLFFVSSLGSQWVLARLECHLRFYNKASYVDNDHEHPLGGREPGMALGGICAKGAGER